MSRRCRFATAGVVNATAAVRKSAETCGALVAAVDLRAEEKPVTSLSRWKADKRRVETKTKVVFSPYV
jgi:hypothetical protein